MKHTSNDTITKEPTMDEPTTTKIGEKEYSQEDLARLVGLGEVAQEYETKWNRKIGDFYPDYTQKSQKLSDYERREAELSAATAKAEEEKKQKELEERARANQLSPQEAKEIARQQARELGLVTEEEHAQFVYKEVANALAAQKLIETTEKLLAEAKEKGQPSANPDDLLKYMEENGLKDPSKAYKLMFEPELDKWKEEQLKKIRPSGFNTQVGSTAGGKTPPPPSPISSREDLTKAIRESLTRSSGS